MTTWNQLFINVLNKATNLHVTADGNIGKSKRNSKKTIIRFMNRKHCKCGLVNRQEQTKIL